MFLVFRLFNLIFFYLLYLFKICLCFVFVRNKQKYKQIKAKLFVNFLQHNGPIFIKLGQLLSTRIDIFDNIYINQLTLLQDKAKIISNKKMFKIFLQDCGKNINDVFQNINLQAISSASIAQVYKAEFEGKPVAIKIIKPFVEKFYYTDTKIIFFIAVILEKISKTAKITKPTSIVNNLKRNLQFELNLKFEASSMEKTQDFFSNEEKIAKIAYIPKVYWQFVSTNVLVSEFIVAEKITNLAFLNKHNINKELLVVNLLTIFFYQALKSGYFHGDMHAGNILVNKNGVIVLIDFGIMDFCSDELKFYLKELFLAFLEEDYKKVADIHFNLGWVDSSHNKVDFEVASRIIMKQIVNKNQKDIQLGEFLKQLFVISQIFKMKIQPSLLNLQKNLLYIENISRELLQDKNVWMLSKNILENLNTEFSNIYLNKKNNYLFKGKLLQNKIETKINDILLYYKYNINHKNAIIWQTRITNLLLLALVVAIFVYLKK